ncbi:MAG: hypothetical protein O7B25_04220 [Gammaproteobacteria bacterium]|nr:hypothetical protein [Gammaproteobacteria bacterium]
MIGQSSHRSNQQLSIGLGASIAIAALISAQAWGQATQCTNGILTRGIEVVYSDPGQPTPCEVIYDKSTEGAGQHSLWRAGSEAGYCEARAAAFVDKLADLGWACGPAPDAAPGASDVIEAITAPAAGEEPAVGEQPAAGDGPVESTDELLGESPAGDSGAS